MQVRKALIGDAQGAFPGGLVIFLNNVCDLIVISDLT